MICISNALLQLRIQRTMQTAHPSLHPDLQTANVCHTFHISETHHNRMARLRNSCAESYTYVKRLTKRLQIFATRIPTIFNQEKHR